MSPFHLFHLSLIGQLWWVLLFLVWVLLWLGLLLLHLVDQSLRSSYLPMTSLAQFRDCHSCYDERSIDQKKRVRLGLNQICQRSCDLKVMRLCLSHIILRIFTGRGVLVVCVLLCVWVALFAFVCFFVFPVKIMHSIWVSFHFEFPVVEVDRLCHVLARQCRKKK